ncbi:MAG: hypothetical protein ABFC18_03430 [Rikenellaceae bacterium]
MKKIFANGWVTLAAIAVTSILDLIGLPTKIQFGAGFVFLFVYLVGFGFYSVTKKDE